MSEAAGVRVVCSPVALAKVALHALKYPCGPVMGLLLGKAAHDRSGREVAVLNVACVSHNDPAMARHPVLEAAVMQTVLLSAAKGLAVVGVYHAGAAAVVPADDRGGHAQIRECAKWVADVAAACSPHPADTPSASQAAASAPFLLFTVNGETLLSQMQAGDDLAGDAPMIFVNSLDRGSWTAARLAGGRSDRPYATITAFGDWSPDRCAVEAMERDVAVRRAAAAVTALGGAMAAEAAGSQRQAAGGAGVVALADFEDHLENVRLDYTNEALDASIKAAAATSPSGGTPQ